MIPPDLHRMKLPHRPVAQWPPLAWAYLGDAVYEWYVRWHVLTDENLRPKHLHKMSTRYVSAEAQSRALGLMLPELSENERLIVQRGRNAKSGHVAKNASVFHYRQSSGFEALIGYLYASGQQERLMELLARTLELIDGSDGSEMPPEIYTLLDQPQSGEGE